MHVTLEDERREGEGRGEEANANVRIDGGRVQKRRGKEVREGLTAVWKSRSSARVVCWGRRRELACVERKEEDAKL